MHLRLFLYASATHIYTGFFVLGITLLLVVIADARPVTLC